MLTKDLYDEIGLFDEWFNPAFGEDTDYWHRAWQLGIELVTGSRGARSCTPAARRRAPTHADLLLQGHRYKYGWKHGVDPLRAPPYYNREIVDYVGTFRAPDRRRDTGATGRASSASVSTRRHDVAARGDDGPRLESLHWGGPALRRLVEASLGIGRAARSRASTRASTPSPTSRRCRRTSRCSTSSIRAAGSC